MSTPHKPSDVRPVSRMKADTAAGPSLGSLQLGRETLLMAGREATYRVAG